MKLGIPVRGGILLCAILLAGCDQPSGQSPVVEDHPELAPMLDQAPEEPLAEAPERQRQAAEPLSASELPMDDRQWVRLMADERIVTRPTGFEAQVEGIDQTSIQLSEGYRIEYRLPPDHQLALNKGQRYRIDFAPTTVRGSEETSLTIYAASPADARAESRTGSVVAQWIQRGGLEPVRIEQADHTIGHGQAERLLQETETDAAWQVEAVVRTGRESTELALGKPVDFQTDSGGYRVTLLQSMHVEQRDDGYSNEGPVYYLEYVLTRSAER